MAIRNIRKEGDPLLRKKSKEVKKIDERIITLLHDMSETMNDINGVGLAAPQVGILKRIVIIQVFKEYEKDGEEFYEPGELYELINPVILEMSGEQINAEACLSLPGESGYVARPEYVKVEALNRNGEKIIVEGTERLAVALCHEIDHLDGILYIDKVIPDEELEDADFDDDFENLE